MEIRDIDLILQQESKQRDITASPIQDLVTDPMYILHSELKGTMKFHLHLDNQMFKSFQGLDMTLLQLASHLSN